MLTGTWLRRSAAGLLLLAGTLAAPFTAAENGKLCAAFQDGKVDQTILATMLNAARRGYLYRIEATTSRVGFCVDSALKRVEGVFADFQGGLVLDQPGSHDGQVLVAIKSASLNTDDQLVGRVIRSRQFFDVEQYPEILFVSRSFEWLNGSTAIMKGDLTLHGVTKPVSFTVQLLQDPARPDSDHVLVKASTRLRRSEFGMDALSSLVSDTVQLCLTVQARRYISEEV